MDNDDAEFSLKDWDLRARIGSRNTGSRRFSASHVRTLREEARSFRSSFVVSSTGSSPGYSLRDEIDPSTYSFSNALKALQAKQAYMNVWDSMSPEGFELNSKWSDAERYICNPLSGEVPMECLSAKTLGQRSFRSRTSRFTMSAPLVYPSNYTTRPIISKPPPPASLSPTNKNASQLPVEENKEVGRTRDVGKQSMPSYALRSTSPTSTPSIGESNVKRPTSEADEDSSNSVSKGEERKTIQAIINGKNVQEAAEDEDEDENDPNGEVQVPRCLSWMMAMRKSKDSNSKMKTKKKKRQKQNTRRKHKLLFLPSEKGC